MPKAMSRPPGTPKTEPATTPRPKPVQTIGGRPVLYPQPSAVYYTDDEALTATQAKELLGWKYEEELTEEEKVRRHILVDLTGKKVWCINNFTNRPFGRPSADQVRQEILRRRWRFNHESIIIGMTGKTLSAQHRLIGLILATQEVELHPDRWTEWDGREPTLATLISFGCREDDETVNTIDTGRARTLSDVIYRSEYFADMGDKDRKQVAKICEHTVKMLWFRTGCGVEAFAPRRTHSESLEFIEHHPQVLKIIRHVYTENDNNEIGRYLSPGYAAGLMYLMSVCSSDPSQYTTRTEQELTFDMEDKALEFWTAIAGTAAVMSGFHQAMVDLTVNSSGTRDERLAVLAKAWNLYVHGKKITEKGLELVYATDENGFRKLAECPTVGGIDLGNPEEAPVNTDPTEKEITKRAAEIRASRPESLPEKPKKAKAISEGDLVWVNEKDDLETVWQGEVLELFAGTAKVKVANGFAGAGSTYSIPFVKLALRSPFDPVG